MKQQVRARSRLPAARRTRAVARVALHAKPRIVRRRRRRLRRGHPRIASRPSPGSRRPPRSPPPRPQRRKRILPRLASSSRFVLPRARGGAPRRSTRGGGGRGASATADDAPTPTHPADAFKRAMRRFTTLGSTYAEMESLQELIDILVELAGGPRAGARAGDATSAEGRVRRAPETDAIDETRAKTPSPEFAPAASVFLGMLFLSNSRPIHRHLITSPREGSLPRRARSGQSLLSASTRRKGGAAAAADDDRSIRRRSNATARRARERQRMSAADGNGTEGTQARGRAGGGARRERCVLVLKDFFFPSSFEFGFRSSSRRRRDERERSRFLSRLVVFSSFPAVTVFEGGRHGRLRK